MVKVTWEGRFFKKSQAGGDRIWIRRAEPVGTASLSFNRFPPSLVVVVVVVVLLLRKQLQLGWNRPASNLWGSPPPPENHMQLWNRPMEGIFLSME